MSYVNSNLLSRIKRRARIPDNQNGYLDADLLELCDEEIRISILPSLLKSQEEYFSFDHDISVTVGRASYPIPSRAIANKLNNVYLISGTSFVALERLFESEKTATDESRKGFYVKNNNIIISPVPTNNTDILRLVFYIRPSDLVLETSCAEILSIDTVLNQVTVSAVPDSITSLKLIDFVKAQPGFQCLEIDKDIISIAGTVFQFSSLPIELSIGDYICLANTSPVVQLPLDFHVSLVQAVVTACLESMSDPRAKQADDKLEKQKQAIVNLTSPRIDRAPNKININM